MTAPDAGVGSAGDTPLIQNQYNPDIVSHPADTIRDTLAAQGKDWRALHFEGGLTKQHAERLVRGEARITIVTARALESTTGLAISFWLRRQELYDRSIGKGGG